MIQILHQIQGHYVFLHKNSPINVGIILILIILIEFFGFSRFLQTLIQPLQLQTINYSYSFFDVFDFIFDTAYMQQPNFVIQLMSIGYLLIPILLIYIAKNYFTRQKQHILTGFYFILIELICLLSFTLISSFTMNAMLIQIQQFIFLNTITFTWKEVIISIFSVLILICLECLATCYMNSFTQIDYKQPYLFHIRGYLLSYLWFQGLFFIVTTISGGDSIYSQFVIMIYMLFLLLLINFFRLFCFSKSHLWIYAVIQFLILETLFQASYSVVAYFLNSSFSYVSILWQLLCTAALSVGLTIHQLASFSKVVENSYQIKNKFFSKCKKKEVVIDYGVPLNFVEQLACYFGPEYVGKIQKNEDDFLLDCKSYKLNQDEAQKTTQNIMLCDQVLEQIKLLYENIYSNVYLTYAMCGQALEHVTLMDIEEALPIPILLKYARLWKNPNTAAMSILQLIQENKSIDAMIDEDYHAVGFFDQFSCHKQHFIKPEQILQSCFDLQSILTKIQQESNTKQNQNKQDDSIEAKRALWHNSYQLPSDQKVHGMLCLLDYNFYLKHQYLFKHIQGDVNKKSVFYVFIPSFTSKSEVTGNIHRLSFSNDTSSMKTPQLRRIRYIAALSFARVLFPLSQKINSSKSFPLVDRYSMQFFGFSKKLKQMFSTVTVKYGPFFTLQNIAINKYKKTSQNLYTVAPFLVNSVQTHNVDDAMLQLIYVEYFIHKMAVTKKSTPKQAKYLKIYNNQEFSAVQKIFYMTQSKSSNIDINIQIFDKSSLHDQIILNALCVCYGCGVIDSRTAKPDEVLATLNYNQHLYDKSVQFSGFQGYINYMLSKLRLLSYNYQNCCQQLQATINQLSDIQKYIKNVSHIMKDYSIEHQTINYIVQKFLIQCSEQLSELLSLKSSSLMEEDQLQLLVFDPRNDPRNENKDNSSDDNVEDNQKYNSRESIQKLHCQVCINQTLTKWINQYNLGKLSNLTTTFEAQQQYELYKKHERDGRISNPFTIKETSDDMDQFIQNSLQALIVINRFISFTESDRRARIKQYKEQSIKVESENNSMLSSEKSNTQRDSFSSSIDEDEMQIMEDQLQQTVFDVSLQNPKKLEEFVASANEAVIAETNDFLFTNIEIQQNTPEFLITQVKGNYVEEKMNFNLPMYCVMLQMISDLNSIKLKDQTLRTKTTVCFIIPRIQKKQSEIENLTLKFLQNLIDAKELGTYNSSSLLQTLNSIGHIDTLIKQLNQARQLLLHRDISLDHKQQIRIELSRSLQSTFGFSMIQKDEIVSADKEKLAEICDTYGGATTQYQDALIKQIEDLPRCGAVQSKDNINQNDLQKEQNNDFKRHCTWIFKFPWEVKKKTSPQKSNLRTRNVTENFCKKTYQYLPTVGLLIGTIIAILFLLTNSFYNFDRSVSQVLHEIDQGMSQNMFRLENMVSILQQTSAKSNFNQQEHSDFFYTQYNQFQRILDRSLQSYIYSKALYTGLSTQSIFTIELNSSDFPLNLSEIMAVSEEQICDSHVLIKNYPTLNFVNQQLSSFGNNQYAQSTLTNFTLYLKKETGMLDPIIIQYNNTLNNQSIIMQAINIILQQSCLGQQLMNILATNMSTQSFSNIGIEIEQLELVYAQQFTPMFQIKMENYYTYLETQQKQCCVVCIVIIVILTYIQIQIFHKKLTNKVISTDLEKGSIVTKISKLQTSDLEKIVEEYKKYLNKQIQVTKNSRQSKKATKTIENKQQSVENDIQIASKEEIKYLKRIANLFSQSNQNVLASILFLIGFGLYFLQLYFKCNSFLYPFKVSQYNAINAFSGVKQLPQQFLPNNNVSTQIEETMLINPYLSNNSQQHPLQASLYYTLNWIQYFTQNPLNSSTLNSFIGDPFSQIIHSKNILQQLKIYGQDIDKNMNLLYFAACTVYKTKLQESSIVQQNIIKANNIYTQSCSEEQYSFSKSEMLEKINNITQKSNSNKLLAAYIIQIIESLVHCVLSFYLISLVVKYAITPCFYNEYNKKFDFLNKIILSDSNLIILIIIVIIVFILQITLIVNAVVGYIQTVNNVYYSFESSTDITLYCFYIVFIILLAIQYDQFTSNALVIFATLGKPELENQYQLPYDMQTPKNLSKYKVFEIFYFLYVLIIILIILLINRSEQFSSDGQDLSKLQTLMNQEATMVQKTIRLNQNNLVSLQHYFKDQESTIISMFESLSRKQQILNQLIDINQYGNVSQLLLINDLIEARWLNALDKDFNRATLSYNDTFSPDFVYGLNNFTQFQSFQPPRTRKIGPHLQDQEDGLRSVSLLSLLTYHSSMTIFMTNLSTLNISEEQYLLSPNNDFGMSAINCSFQQHLILSYQKFTFKDLVVVNEILNAVAFELLNEDANTQLQRDQIMFWCYILIDIIVSFAIIGWFAWLQKEVSQYILRNSQFVSLFLKKKLLQKDAK